jgi:hypothetical protein
MRDRKFLETKGGVMLLGGIEIAIGLFAALYAVVQFSEFDPETGAIAGIVMGVWAVLLPIIGLVLIGIGQNKIGGVILVIGSVICIPIGLVGIMGGINAFKLDD